MLPFCIGDFIGVPFLLSGLEPECEMECAQGEECVHADPDDNLVHLQYGSVRIPLTVDDCPQPARPGPGSGEQIVRIGARGQSASRGHSAQVVEWA